MAAVVDQAAEHTLPTPEPDNTLKRQLTVLVVDDEPLVLMNTVLMLEDLGHSVGEVSSGEDVKCCRVILHSIW